MIDSVCGFETTLISPIADFTIEWLSDDLNLSSSTSPEILVTSAAEGDYSVSLIANSQEVCFDTTIYALSFYEQPVISVPEDFSVCGLNTEIQATPSVGNLIWETTVPGASFSDPAEATTDFSVPDFGEATAIILELNGPCFSTDSVTVSFEPAPQIFNPEFTCTGIDATYQITFEAEGDYGNGFEVSFLEGAFSGNIFISDFIETGTKVDFSMSNGTICSEVDLTGSFTCPVITLAGEMALDTLRVCGDELAVVTQTTPSALDGNDVLKYVLHDSDTDVLGNISAWSDIPEFTYNQTLQFNTIYFVSAVVGNPLGDEIDLTHPQVSVSAGQPIIFLPQPSVSLNYNEIICPTETAFLTFEFAGNLPQTFTYFFNDIETTIQVEGPSLELAFNDSGIVQSISTLSQYCQGNVIGIGQIEYHPETELEYSWDQEICTGDTSWLTLNPFGVSPYQFDLTDQVSQQSYTISGDTALALTIGGRYSIVNFTDQLCPLLDTFQIELEEYPLPVVDAGLDQIVCTGDTILIGAAPNAGVSYSWSANADILNQSLSLTQFAASNESFVPQENELILTANTIYCTDRDTVLISVYSHPDLQIIAPAFYVRAIRWMQSVSVRRTCFGRRLNCSQFLIRSKQGLVLRPVSKLV